MCDTIDYINLQDISFSFKNICRVAKDIKPDDWCIVASNQRLSFIEITLPQFGPAALQRQLIVNTYLQVEAYVGTKKICEESVNTDDINSVLALKKCLRVFASFGTCSGNRNFHRNSTNDYGTKTEYWRHNKCLMLYEMEKMRREQCCDMCLQLNIFLTKKQRKQVIPYKSSEIEDDSPESKKIKTEAEDGENTVT